VESDSLQGIDLPIGVLGGEFIREMFPKNLSSSSLVRWHRTNDEEERFGTFLFFPPTTQFTPI
jgi:hypothetical protein